MDQNNKQSPAPETSPPSPPPPPQSSPEKTIAERRRFFHSEEKKETGETTTHSSLHHSLLGPSLLKAGQNGVDQQKVAQLIYEASKGSKFFKHEEKRDEILSKKIEKLLERKKQIEARDLSHAIHKADIILEELETERDLSQYIVHVDCDAFYASVEELDRPELKEVPMAVGGSVLTTCNYKAREFGVRSAMAGHVAKKICPQLVLVPVNFKRYNEKAAEIRSIIAQYDPNYESASCDEAYLNITRYCAEHQMEPVDAVSQMRSRIHNHTKLTVSAGIGPNTLISKISSNMNKPNGQFVVANRRDAVMDFIAALPVRKIHGIGRVQEREFASIGVVKCGDIFKHRGILVELFTETMCRFLFASYLGLGRTDVHPADEYERKTIGTENTFRDLSGSERLRAKMKDTAAELEQDMVKNGAYGKNICLKLKMHDYTLHTRQRQLHRAIRDKDDIYREALPLLRIFETEFGDRLKIRLMGLRLGQLVREDELERDEKRSIKNWVKKKEDVSSGALGDKALMRDEAMEDLEEQPPDEEAGSKQDGAETSDAQQTEPKIETWPCPICEKQLPAIDTTFNAHVDFCLSKDAIMETVRTTASPKPRSVLKNAPRATSTPSTPRPTTKTPPEKSLERERMEIKERREEGKHVEYWNCPICNRKVEADDLKFNQHVDICLSRGTIMGNVV